MWGWSRTASWSPSATSGANLVPVRPPRRTPRAFAERALARRPTVSTVVGPHAAVAPFWDGGSSAAGAAPRERALGPAAHGDRAARGSSPTRWCAVRPRTDLAVLYPACVAMYTEEVASRRRHGGGAELYRARVEPADGPGLVLRRGSRTDRLVFKAEVACATPSAGQIQGVCVPPDRRGRALPPRAWPRSWPRACARSPRSSRSTSTTATGRPPRPTRGRLPSRTATFSTVMF